MHRTYTYLNSLSVYIKHTKPRIEIPEDYPFPKQKIVCVTRTLNEESNIERFCDAYRDFNNIIICDGGSTDNTLELARQFPNTDIHHFPRIQYLPNGMPFNPEGAHTSFAIETAKRYNPDWLFFDDCDSVPNPFLQSNARFLLKEHPYPAIFVQRVYAWHDGQSYFPEMTRGYALWGWKPKEIEIHGDTSCVLHPKLDGVPCSKENVWNLPISSALIHFSWNSEQEVARKMEFYSAQGRPESHPLRRCGRLEQLKNWMVD